MLDGRRVIQPVDRFSVAVLRARIVGVECSRSSEEASSERCVALLGAGDVLGDGVVRESADLMYNLAVLWAELGLTPADVWREMERRERLYGIAEKLAKPDAAPPNGAGAKTARRDR